LGSLFVACAAAYFGYYLGSIKDAAPSTQIAVAEQTGPITGRCISIHGEGDTTSRWQIWTAAHTADQIGGQYTLVPVAPSGKDNWTIRLTLGADNPDTTATTVASDQNIEVDVFYLDADTSNLLKQVQSQPAGSWPTFTAIPPGAHGLAAYRITLPRGADEAACS